MVFAKVNYCGCTKGILKKYYSKGETDFVKCTICSTVFRKKFPSSNSLRRIYKLAYQKQNIALSDTDQESTFFALHSYYSFFIFLFLQHKKKILDFGSGTGKFLSLLHENGISADGYEYSASARRYCKKTYGFKLISNLNKIKNNKYDLIIMIEVIEHLDNLEITLKKLHNKLSINGELFLTTPNRNGLRALIERGYWREAQKKFHLFLFNKTSLLHHLNKAGFKEVKFIRFSPILKPGIINFIYTRFTQLIGFPGSICLVAKK
jgi:SAM-dependent methyltransferase